ncbi:MAG: hypothetical protein IPL53_21405 [Ignavibacteria bacterium]|nr:hypothetical protein [Ignavibacteria bacterium]
MFTERQVGITLFSTISGYHIRTNTDILAGIASSNEYNFGGQFDLHFNATPRFAYDENFQSDALVDLYITKGFLTNSINISIREAYIDFLFFDFIDVKSGFVKLDYRFNGYYHPLNINEFIPDFKKLYQQISIGTEQQGFPGVPSFNAAVSFHDFLNIADINIKQSLVLFNPKNFEQNYFITSMKSVLGNNSFEILTGFTKGKHPVFGGSLSVLLPFGIMMFWEGIYKSESFKSWIYNAQISNYVDNINIFNTSLRFDYSIQLFKNKLGLSLEYFYYDDSLSTFQYDEIYNFLKTPTNLIYYGDLINSDKNFKHNLYVKADYNISDLNLRFNYRLIVALEQSIFQQTFVVVKSLNNASLTLAFVNYINPDVKYDLVYQGMDNQLYLTLGLEI